MAQSEDQEKSSATPMGHSSVAAHTVCIQKVPDSVWGWDLFLLQTPKNCCQLVELKVLRSMTKGLKQYKAAKALLRLYEPKGNMQVP